MAKKSSRHPPAKIMEAERWSKNARPSGASKHQFRLITPLLALATAILSASLARAADDVAAFSMSIDEFRAMAPADQKALLASVFEHRLEHARNIHYEVLQLVDVVEHDAALRPIGKVLKRLNGSRFRHWVLGKSFRMDTIRGGEDVTNPKMFVASCLDADSGVARSTVRLTDDKRVFGRIDSQPDAIDDSNTYARWLDGAVGTDTDSVPRYLFEYRDEVVIDPVTDGGAIRVTVPWYYYGETEPWGTRVFSLDPEKGFIPIHGKSRLQWPGKSRLRLDEFVVEEGRLVGSVWMPTRLKWIIDSTGAPGTSSVEHITIKTIEAGTVTPRDVQVPFDPGIEVIDAIKGESYVVGENDERSRIRPLVGAAGQQPPARRAGNRLVWIGLGNLLVVVAALFVRRFMTRRYRRAARA